VKVEFWQDPVITCILVWSHTLTVFLLGLNFINVLRTAFTGADPESVIIHSNPQYLLRLWDLQAQKLYIKMLVEFGPSGSEANK